MNPDVFITIVFVGIAVLAAVVALVFVVPQIRRDDARVRRSSTRSQPSERTTGRSSAAVH
jgi:hypothetical protein